MTRPIAFFLPSSWHGNPPYTTFLCLCRIYYVHFYHIITIHQNEWIYPWNMLALDVLKCLRSFWSNFGLSFFFVARYDELASLNWRKVTRYVIITLIVTPWFHEFINKHKMCMLNMFVITFVFKNHGWRVNLCIVTSFDHDVLLELFKLGIKPLNTSCFHNSFRQQVSTAKCNYKQI